MSKLLGSYVSNKRRQAQDYLESWQSTVYSMVVFSATMVVIFWASVFLYTSFYFTFMPQESITWPIHFQFRSCEKEPGICSNPSAVIPVLDPMRGSLLVRGQKYRVVVDLEMPESPVNQRIGNAGVSLRPGMFLLNMEMKNQGGETLRQSSRSAMLRYKSELLHIISTTVFAPLLLYGLQEEKQVVTVELFSQYEEDPLLPLSEVHIELASRHVELYAAQMRIHATFSGLRYFMYNYPLSAAAVGVGICMVFLSAVVILSWYQFSGPTLSPVQASRGMVSFPNGSAPIISTHIASPPVKKVVEDKDKDDGGSGGGGGGGGAPSSRVLKIEPDEKSAKGEDKKVPSDSQSNQMSQDSPAGEKPGDREDFEIVSSSRPQGVTLKEEEEEEGFPGPKRSTSSEEESVVRQRVQTIS
ncbi:seipin-like isoform X2 [Portunus trituberculatus]|uniref:seipin-like isoform X2 n=1 Tax=Portunus trituberculatus TaxID=210409 RepID=UPI001E1CED11|nr:seipin-like isoform X2 [Portunus trituberculatus]